MGYIYINLWIDAIAIFKERAGTPTYLQEQSFESHFHLPKLKD